MSNLEYCYLYLRHKRISEALSGKAAAIIVSFSQNVKAPNYTSLLDSFLDLYEENPQTALEVLREKLK